MPTTVYTTTFSADDVSNLQNWSLRQFVKCSAALLSQVRCTFRFSASGMVIDHMSIGKANQQPPTTSSDTAAIPVELKIAGVSGMSGSGSITKTTDWGTSPAGAGGNWNV